MARALVRGWGEPVLCTDLLAGSRQGTRRRGRRRGGRDERGAGAARRLRPALPQARRAVGGRARTSEARRRPSSPSSARRRWRASRQAYPGTPVVRMLPSTPVEVANGVCCHARDPEADRDFEATVLELFGRVGPVVTVDESLIDAAMGLMSCAPAYYALVAEAQIDAGVRRGLPAEVARQLVVGTMGGTAALLEHRGRRHARASGARSRLRAARPRAGWTRWSGATCGPRSPTRWTPCWTVDGDRPRHGPRRTSRTSSAR